MAIYKPARGTHRKLKDLSSSEDSTKEEVRILVSLCAGHHISETQYKKYIKIIQIINSKK